MTDQLPVSLDDLKRAIDAYEDIPLDFHHAGESNAALAKAWQTAFDWREQRIQTDAALVANRIVAATPAVAAAVEVLLTQAKELLETAA